MADKPADFPELTEYKPSRFMLPTSHYDEKKAERAVRFRDCGREREAAVPHGLRGDREKESNSVPGRSDVATQTHRIAGTP